MALITIYNTDCQAGNLIKFLKQVRTVCFGSNDKGLSFGPYKQVGAVKLMNNCSNNKPYDPHGFKERRDQDQVRCRKVSSWKIPGQKSRNTGIT